MKRKGLPLNGWFNLDKPVGLTSTQAMARVRRLLNAEKAGHGGTLDPLASGILPIALGEATKTVAYVMDAFKTYRFTVTWGESRTTDDGEGEVIARSDLRPTSAAITAALPAFLGEISQRPPIYSALKVAGERAYDLARAGEEVILENRFVFVESFKLLACPTADQAVFEVVCGKGTYVRALARDLAEKLGTLGYVSDLRRLAVGRFTIENAIPLDVLEEKVHNTPAERLLLPLETALDDIPALAITALEAQRLRLGQRVSLLQAQHRDRLMALPETVRIGSDPVVMLCEGRAVGLGEVAAGELRTVRLFNSNPNLVKALKQQSNRAEPGKDYPMSITAERKQTLMKDFATSKNDTGSPQVQVAVLTDRIKALTSHFGIHKKDNHSRRGMLKMVARRRKLLDYLKKHNTEAYDSIVARLGLRG